MTYWIRRSLLLTALCAASLAATAADVRVAAPTVTNAWARATAPGATVGAAYLTLQGGPSADRLVAASTPRASMTMIHVITAADGMMRMRETDGVDVPAGKRITLEPQGTHVMLMGLTQQLVAGERFPLTLEFEKAGKREVSVLVAAPANAPPTSN